MHILPLHQNYAKVQGMSANLNGYNFYFLRVYLCLNLFKNGILHQNFFASRRQISDYIQPKQQTVKRKHLRLFTLNIVLHFSLTFDTIVLNVSTVRSIEVAHAARRITVRSAYARANWNRYEKFSGDEMENGELDFIGLVKLDVLISEF